MHNSPTETVTGGYDAVARSLHWLVFVLLLTQFVVAFTMPAIHRGVVPETLINMHMSFGATILAVMIARLLWRFAHPAPPTATNVPVWMQRAAQTTHFLLYALLLILPILGWANASTRDWHISLFGFFDLPPLLPAQAPIGHVLGDTHVLLSWVLLALIALHVAGGLFHYFVLRDRVLQRMLPRGES